VAVGLSQLECQLFRSAFPQDPEATAEILRGQLLKAGKGLELLPVSMSLKAKLCLSALVKTVQTLPTIQLLQLQRSILGREALTNIIEAKVEVVVAQAQSQLVTASF
jgi:uncharacterized membrane protein